MGLFDKAKAQLSEVTNAANLNDGLRKLGLGDNKTSTTSETGSTSTTAYTPATSVSGNTAERSMSSSDVNTSIPPCTAPDAPKRINMAARKDLKEQFDPRKAEFEQFFGEQLGGTWSINIDTGNLFTYTKPGDSAHDNFGYYISQYFIYNKENIKDFVREFGEDGKKQLNGLAYKHVITIEPLERQADAKWEYGTVGFKDGKLQLLFDTTKFGTNPNYCLRNLGAAVSAAETPSDTGRPTMNMEARKDIRERYDTKIEELQERARKYLKFPTLEFVPNFEHNYAAYSAYEQELKDSPDERDIFKIDKDWRTQFGRDTYGYFYYFVEYLRDEGFHREEDYQEGFKDVVEKGQVCVRVVPDKLIKETSGEYEYNDAVVEDGVLVLRTNVEYFGKNVQNASKKIMKLL